MKYELYQGTKRPSVSEQALLDHVEFLKQDFYQVETKWPQFQILFDEFAQLNKTLCADDTVLVLERAYFYGGFTLFAPILANAQVVAVDCVVSEDDNRFGQQLSWLEDERCIKWRPDHVSYISDLKCIETGSMTHVLVPNVIHHERDQAGLFAEINRVLKPGGQCLIFEGLVRELHHMPQDYLRYTPGGISVMFENAGLTTTQTRHGTGVFDVLAYVWQQALEYFPDEIRQEKIDWFYKEHYPYLQALDKKYPTNIAKPDKSFPMSYIVWAEKA